MAGRLAGGRNWCGFLSSCRGVGSLAADDTDVMVVVVVDAGSGSGSKLLTLSSLSSLESLLLLTIVAGVAVKICPSLTNRTLRVAGTGGASVGSFGAGVSSGLRSDHIAALTDIHVVVGGGGVENLVDVFSTMLSFWSFLDDSGNGVFFSDLKNGDGTSVSRSSFFKMITSLSASSFFVTGDVSVSRVIGLMTPTCLDVGDDASVDAGKWF